MLTDLRPARFTFTDDDAVRSELDDCDIANPHVVIASFALDDTAVIVGVGFHCGIFILEGDGGRVEVGWTEASTLLALHAV